MRKRVLAVFGAFGAIFLTILVYGYVQDHQMSQSSAGNLGGESFGTVQFYDKRGTFIVYASTTPGTRLVIDELKTLDDVSGQMNLTLDSELQDYMYGALEQVAQDKKYVGGAGVIMDIETGELLVLTSYTASSEPENKATNGLFIPGSIIKPFIALAALSEGIIDPKKEILSTGSLTLTDTTGKTVFFNDWRAHGYVDMRKALGVSSNVYFYAIGGGYEDQLGLGINRINDFLRLFGIGEPTGLPSLSEVRGQIPDPEWKKEHFNGDDWRVGDTYLASIGQHGYEVTPLQMTRAVAAIATEGTLVSPVVTASVATKTDTAPRVIDTEHYEVVKEGMEYAVLNGTASGLYMDGYTLAAKTGTAETDMYKEHIHSWLIGYFPHDTPRYAFTFMLEEGPWGEETGAVAVARDVFTWLARNRPEYFTAMGAE